MILTGAIAASAAALTFLSGYLYGARRGTVARRVLEEEQRHAEARAQVLEVQVAHLSKEAQAASEFRTTVERMIQPMVQREDGTVRELRQELSALSRSIQAREAAESAHRTELKAELSTIAKQAQDPVRLERDLKKLVSPLLERDAENRSLREMMQKALGPMMERDRLGRELAQIESGAGLRELPALLDGIAQKAGFSSVVLSDDVGLPLAASSGATGVEWTAGMSSLLLTLVDRAERSGEPKPIAVVLHDESNQMVLHRIFSCGGSRFLLSAVSRGQYVAPGTLDPALAKLERALSRPEIHA